ncbi:uncharacterized protein [Rutidosis leptorrhynchoides]|uniref:uncharacterized protein n=1 Tax=Rutidosis leptorrhynchoides TaxID=125765 RepID=UPI003A9A1BD8
MAPDRVKWLCEEVTKLVRAGILREVQYQSWIANPVLVKKPDELEVINERTALKPVLGETWDLFTDGASCAEGAGAGLVLASPSGEEHTYALRFIFDVTNNEAEYEALLAGLNIARKMNIVKLRVFTDSQLVANQFNGSFEAHDPSMRKYLQLLKEMAARFEHF